MLRWLQPVSARLGNCGFNYYCGPTYGEDVCSCQAGYADAYNAAACVDGSTSGSYCSTGGGNGGASDPYLEVDLGSNMYIDYVYLWQRGINELGGSHPGDLDAHRVLVRPDGTDTAKITHCNIEGYGGLAPQFKAATEHMLAQMPGGRCPYPPGDRPGMLGFDSRGHYVGGKGS